MGLPGAEMDLSTEAAPAAALTRRTFTTTRIPTKTRSYSHTARNI
jgi:hypothetical protein